MAISAPHLNYLRNGHPHGVRLYLSPLAPQVIYQGQVTGSPDRGDRVITLSDVSGNISNIIAGMTAIVGTTAGDDDVPDGRRRRVRSRSGQDVTFDENSTEWANGQYVTIVENWELFPVFPYITPDGPPFIFYKDRDLTYASQSDPNKDIDPVAIIKGNHMAKFLDGNNVSFTLDGTNSYAVAYGASITGYSWSCTGGSIASASAGTTTITFTTPNKDGYWLTLTVTDSNGKTSTTRRVIFVCTRTGDNKPHSVQIQDPPSGDWGEGGWRTQIAVREDGDVTNFQDRTLVVLWSEETYDGVPVEIGDDGNIEMIGYIRGETINSTVIGTEDYVAFTITTIEDLLRRHPVFSISLEDKSNPSKWYHMHRLTVARAVHHMWRWHSTLMGITNVFLPIDDETRIPAVDDFINGNLYTCVEQFTAQHGIFAHVCCNKKGEVYVEVDFNMYNDTDRAALDVQMDLSMADLRGDPVFSIIREYERQVSYGVLDGVSYDGSDTSPLVSIAPSEVPYVDGDGQLVLTRQVLSSQTDGNEKIGRALAIANSVFKGFPTRFAGNYSFIDIVPQYWHTITLEAQDTKRGLVLTNMKMVPRTVTNVFDPEAMTIMTDVTYEPDADGQDGIPGQYPSGIELPALPVLSDITGIAIFDQVNGCYVNGSWIARNGTLTGSAIQDRHGGCDYWWSISQVSLDFQNKAIMYKCDNGAIYKTTDYGQTWSAATPSSGPDGYSASSFEYIQYEGNLSNYREHAFLARYNDGGTWVSYVLYTYDDGDTWTWTSVGGAGTVAFDSYETPVDVTNDWPAEDPDLESRGFEASIYRVARLTETLYVFVWWNTAGPNYSHFVRAFDTATGLFGASVEVSALGPTPETGDVSIAALSSSQFIVGYNYYNSAYPTEFHGAVRVGTVGGGPAYTITMGDPEPVDPDADWNVFGGSYWDITVERIDNTHAIVTYGNSLTNPANVDARSHAAVVTTSGNNCVVASPAQFTEDGITRAVTLLMSSSKVITIWNKYVSSGVRDLKARWGTLSGTGIVYSGNECTLITDTGGADTTPRFFHAKQIDSTRFIIGYVYDNAYGYAAIGYIDGYDVDIGTEAVINDYIPVFDSQGLTLDVINSSFAAVTYVYWDNPTNDIAVRLIEFSGYSISSVGTENIQTTDDNDEQPQVLLKSSDELLILYRTDDDSDTGDYYIRYVIADLTITSVEAKAYGMSIGKGNGDLVHVTYCDDTHLVLKSFLTLGFAEYNSAYLGEATISEVDARTWWALPRSLAYSDIALYVYGRMDDPLGSGTINIFYTGDVGLTGFEVAQWGGSDYCSALLTDTSGRVYAIRHKAAGSDFYYGAGLSLSKVSSIPLHVNAGALAITSSRYILVGGNSFVGGKVLLYTSFPFTEWHDISLDYPSPANITAIVVVQI